MEDYEVDVAECIFTVTENGEEIWKGEDIDHAFFLKKVAPESRKVFVKAKVDVTLEEMSDIMQAKNEDIPE